MSCSVVLRVKKLLKPRDQTWCGKKINRMKNSAQPDYNCFYLGSQFNTFRVSLSDKIL